MSRKTVWFLAVCPLLFGFDWCTKEAARTLPVGGSVQVVPGWLSFLHAENPYIAFSMPVPHALIFLFGFVALAMLGWTLWKLPADAKVQAAALAAIAAGALGNLLDRLMDGSVTDFVAVYTRNPTLEPWLVHQFGTATWPIFNVADASLLCGVALWVGYEALRRDPEPAPSDDVPA